VCHLFHACTYVSVCILCAAFGIINDDDDDDDADDDDD